MTLFLCGLVLLALLIWFLGPYLAFADVRPLAGVTGRAVAIATVTGILGGVALLRRQRTRRANRRLRSELVAGAPSDGAGEELRRRFEEAVRFLRESRKGGNLYELPWYVIIGPPGAGKTTALVNSGLSFPLSEKFGKASMRGVGGTRNCDWWFTDEAVLLDTAGRYLSQDTDPGADSSEWRRFLELLARYRKRRPLNGVIVTLSADDLLTMTARTREQHVMAVRRRLDEVQRTLRIRFPVYLMITKCDLVAGFTEYFDDLDLEGRSQVWGITFPHPDTGGEAPADELGREYPRLLARLNERVLQRLDQERDARRRALLFGFPRQMAGLEEALRDFVAEAFSHTAYDRPVMLRGVYLTSGTQEGTPIDRMMGTLARSFGLDAESSGEPQTGQGRSYFLRNLLRDVIFPESGLAGVNWRLEVGRAVAQNVAYVSVLILAGLLVVAWATSYRYNREYLADVESTLEVHRERATMPVPADAGLRDVLPRLDALREVADSAGRHRGDVPLLMGLGLYRGDAVGKVALDAYDQGLRQLLLPRIGLLLEARMRAARAEPKRLYGLLKAYIMLAEPEHQDPAALAAIVRAELARSFDDSPPVARALALHFEALTGREPSPRISSPDTELIARARTALAQASIPVLMMSRLETVYDRDHGHALRLDLEAGLGSEEIFRRSSGVPLSEPVPALYTRAGFEEITGDVGSEMVQAFLRESWVLGEDVLPSGPTARFELSAEFLRHYEQAYIEFWEELLADLEVAPLLDVGQATDVLATLSGPTSPLRQLLATVDRQTHFPEPDSGAAEEAASAARGGRLAGLLDFASEATRDVTGPRPGARISEHFRDLHRMVAGGESGTPPIDGVIALLGELYAQLDSMGSGLGQQDVMTVLSRSGARDALSQLRVDAERAPGPVGEWLGELAGKGQEVALRSLRGELNQRYREQVASECRAVVEGRYPFETNSQRDVPLSDFARLFGPGGAFDRFFQEHLAALVDTGAARWRWRTQDGVPIGIPDSVLEEFQRARAIRDMFFAGGGAEPRLQLRLTPAYLDGRVRRFALTLDGQQLVYRHGPPRGETFTWPGPDSGRVIAEFEDRGGQRPNVRFEGPWALFRALQASGLAAESETRFTATFEAGDYTARVRVAFDTARNPLGRRDWMRFRCPGRL
ncbi:type VI secretion system membrane subunit TssM [Spiribacter halobius]|uniref:Type VI secretion system membrane subunit TssM n=2 Tax=Sediminicurvatus halobius TaxID=2182432 RepID=A0A2U2N2G5_9GAMM|nr:type VI secretion system membrane subunit TssM [Spiribacter halobius]